MKRVVTVVALAFLMTTAGCSALTGASASGGTDAAAADAVQETGQPTRTVAVGASGQVQTAPDRAVVEVAVTARADSVEEVRDQLAANASRMRTALVESGIEGDQITSARFDIGRNIRADDRPDEPEFRGQHAFVITVDDTSRAGEVVVTAVENGATNVDQVRFTITPETRNDLRKQALSKAVANARGEADVIAADTGLSLAGVRTVQTGDVSTDPIRREDLAFAGGDGGSGGGVPTSFDSGKVTVTADVSVVFNATDA